MNTVTYDTAREKLAEIWDEIEESRGEVILRRRGHEDLALLAASELSSLKETVHLLSSPRNALRLLRALARSRGECDMEAETPEAPASEVGLNG